MIHSDLHIETIGDPGKEAVLFFHGFMGSGKDFNKIAKGAFSKKYYSILIDLPGHGNSLNLADHMYQFSGLWDALDELLKQCRKTKAFVGYSMGARIALSYYLERKPRIDQFVFESGNPGLENERLIASRKIDDQQLLAKLRKDDYAEFLTYWYDQALFNSLNENSEVKTKLIESRMGNKAEEVGKALKGFSISTQKNYWPELKNLDIPVLLLSGERDCKYAEIVKRMSALISDAKEIVFTNSGHIVHVEEPEPYKRAVEKFLKG